MPEPNGLKDGLLELGNHLKRPTMYQSFPLTVMHLLVRRLF
jgi:hypothetical protein